jgi:hypothetical protein
MKQEIRCKRRKTAKITSEIACTEKDGISCSERVGAGKGTEFLIRREFRGKDAERERRIWFKFELGYNTFYTSLIKSGLITQLNK